MNSSTTIGLSIAEIVFVLVSACTFVATVVGLSFRVGGKLQLERTLTENSIKNQKDLTDQDIRAQEKLFNQKLESRDTLASERHQKILSEMVLLKDSIRQEMERKFDGLKPELEAIKSIVTALSRDVASKYVERGEIAAGFKELTVRIGDNEKNIIRLGEQGLTGLVGAAVARVTHKHEDQE